jgi:hypothetical protein
MKDTIKLLTTFALAAAVLPAQALMLNEIRIDHPGSDTDEYIEIKGTPGESLDGVWFLYIGDHSGSGSFKGSGTIELAYNLSGTTIPADGHYLIAGPNLHGTEFGLTVEDVDFFIETLGTGPGLMENSDNVTVMLVTNFTGNGGNNIRGIDDQLGDLAVDIDDNDDGVPNEVLPWESVIDAVGLVESTSSGELYYGVAFNGFDLGPDNGFVPSHSYRTSDTEEWSIGQFNLFETDANDIIIGLDPGASDTPGSENPVANTAPSITSLSTIFAVSGDVVTVSGIYLNLVTSVTVSGLEAQFSVSDADLLVTIPDGFTAGPVEVTNPSGSATSLNLIVPVDADSAALAEDFSAGLGDFSAYSLSGESVWIGKTGGDAAYVEMGGFFDAEVSDDWLVSPAIDLSVVTNAFLRIGHERRFDGPALEVKVSTDYSGTGDPSLANWADISIQLGPDNSFELVDSGEADISAYDGQTIYVAVRYITTIIADAIEGATDRIHYLVVGGDEATLGWNYDINLGWIYYYSADWAFSYDLGYIYVTGFPWVYQSNFGYLYHIARAEGVGIWFYSQTLEWVWVAESGGGFFQASGNGWQYDNFINPIN